jgi:hypothetical protein
LSNQALLKICHTNDGSLSLNGSGSLVYSSGATILEEVTMFLTRLVLAAVTTACSLLLVSPSAVHAADGKVTGKVTVAGKPLASGRIIFHLDDGQFVGSKVKNGDYTIDRVPVGTRKVTVEGKGVPDKYADEETSGLKLEVKEGVNTIDINIEP